MEDIFHLQLFLNILLWISNGDPDKVQNIEEQQYKPFIFPHEWIIDTLAVKPNDSQIVYLKTNGKNLFQLYSRDVLQGSLGAEQLIPFDTSQWAYKPQWAYTQLSVNSYSMVWRPNSAQIFLTANNGNEGSLYSFLLDMNTGKICGIDFGSALGEPKRAWVARWSPNGRYLAIEREWDIYPNGFSDLDVLDTLTGKQYILAFSPDVAGMHFVTDIAWAPDNYHLVAIGQASAFPHCASKCMEDVNRLYLVDFVSGTADLLFPSFQFSIDMEGTNLAWSPDGSKILATCRDGNESRLCLVPVQRTGR